MRKVDNRGEGGGVGQKRRNCGGNVATTHHQKLLEGF